MKIKVEECNNTLNPPLEPSTIPISNNTYNQQVDNPTSGEEDINALKEVIKSLKKEIEMLKNNKEDALKEETSKETAIVPSGEIDYDKIINRLNQLTGASYWSDSKNTRSLIKARFNEGFKEEDFMMVIEKMNYLWNIEPKKGEKDMRLYLRPSTLFGTKFEQYLNMPIQQRNLTTGDLVDKMDFSDFHTNEIVSNGKLF